MQIIALEDCQSERSQAVDPNRAATDASAVAKKLAFATCNAATDAPVEGVLGNKLQVTNRFLSNEVLQSFEVEFSATDNRNDTRCAKSVGNLATMDVSDCHPLVGHAVSLITARTEFASRAKFIPVNVTTVPPVG